MHLPELRYDCIACGKSCTDFRVPLDPPDLESVQQMAAKPPFDRPNFVALKVQSEQTLLWKQDDGRCSFLDQNTRCSIHQEAGFLAKPKACREFPFLLQPTPDGLFVGVSFYCSAVAQGEGRWLEERRTELEYLVPEAGGSLEADSQWSLWGEMAVDWASYLRIESYCRAGVQEAGYLGLSQAAGRLGRAVVSGDLGWLSSPVTIDIPLTQLALALFAEIGLVKPLEDGVLPACDPGWFTQKLNQYLDHLLFRKSLLKAPNVLSLVCLLPVAAQVVRLVAYAQALQDRRELHLNDFRGAVGLVEGRLMAHAQGLEELFAANAQRYLASTL